MRTTVDVEITRYKGNEIEKVKDTVATERYLKIILGDTEFVTLLCTPSMVKELAVGFLVSEGTLKGKWCSEEIDVIDKDDVVIVRIPLIVDPKGDPKGSVVVTSGCGKGITFAGKEDITSMKKIASDLTVSIGEIRHLLKDFRERSELYRTTACVHSAALCKVASGNHGSPEIVVFAEDLGRHNAVDKVFGYSLLNGVSTEDKVLIVSGRVSSEVLQKAALRNVPVVMSRTAPTSFSVEMAERAGITLIGFARRERMNIYSNDWRVKNED